MKKQYLEFMMGRLREHAHLILDLRIREIKGLDTKDEKSEIMQIEIKINRLREEIYGNTNILDEIDNFTKIKKSVYRTTYENLIETLEKGYRPCEDCFYTHKNLNGENLSPEDNLWCSLHPEYSGIKDSAKIMGCREKSFKSHYQNRKYNEEIPLTLKIIREELEALITNEKMP